MGAIPEADPDEPQVTKPFKFVTGKLCSGLMEFNGGLIDAIANVRDQLVRVDMDVSRGCPVASGVGGSSGVIMTEGDGGQGGSIRDSQN